MAKAKKAKAARAKARKTRASKSRIFVSHVSEEASLAAILKDHLSRDFLGYVDIFVSSDIESISAGQNWLNSLDTALGKSSALLVLCSHASLNQAWVNFEVGAAWIKRIPIVPICHSGLLLRNLPVPFSVLQGVEANTESGFKRIYSLVADILGCSVPRKDFAPLIAEIAEFERGYKPQLRKSLAPESQSRPGAKERIYEALAEPDHRWRNVKTLAIKAGISENEVLDLLVRDANVVLGKSARHGGRIARLKDR